MCSSSPMRTPKLQLAAEQPSTGICCSPPKKYTPRPEAKKKPQQDGRRGEITFRIKTYTLQRCSAHLEGRQEHQASSLFLTPTLRPQGPCRVGSGELGLVLSEEGILSSPLEITILVSVAMNLSTLNTSYQWYQRVFIFL